MSTQISVAPKEGPNGYFPLHVNIRVKPELLCIEEQKSFNKLSVLKRLMLNVGEQSRSNFINVKHKKLLVLRLSMVLNLTNLVIGRLKSFETFVLYFFLFDTQIFYLATSNADTILFSQLYIQQDNLYFPCLAVSKYRFCYQVRTQLKVLCSEFRSKPLDCDLKDLFCRVLKKI